MSDTSRSSRKVLSTLLAGALTLVPHAARADTSSIKVAKHQYVVEWSSSPSLQSHAATGLALNTSALRTLGENSRASLVEVDERGNITSPENSPEVISYDNDNSFCEKVLTSGMALACSPNYILNSGATPNDPRLSEEWGHRAIDSAAGWDVTKGGQSNIVIAIIDTGTDYNHPDLKDNIWTNSGEIAGNGIDDDHNGVIDDVHGYNAITSGGDPMDDNMHGTHVAGIIGAKGNNGIGVVGVHWTAKMMPIKFLSGGGWGYLSDAIKGIDYMVAMKNRGVNIRVVNNSWGGGGFSSTLLAAIRRARDAGIIFVAAAGNSGTDNDVLASYPASYEVDNVVSVASSQEGDTLSSFSCFGLDSVDIAAPGSSILSTLPDNQYGSLSGTSMATPFISGALGLLLDREPSLTNVQAIERLYRTAKPVAAFEGMIKTGRLLNLNNLLNNRTVTEPISGEVCNYTYEPIPFNPDHSVDSTTIQIPMRGAGYVSNQTLTLPFDFPFYHAHAQSVTVSPNGVIFTQSAESAWNYSDRPTAPQFSIAPLYTYLFDYEAPTAPYGVRYVASADKAQFYWNLIHPWNREAGSIKIWLTIYKNGDIEEHVSLDNDRIARTLQYGALIGIRGENLSNSLTVTHNGFPVALRGQFGYRIHRPTSCAASPTSPREPTPTPTPNPSETPSPTPTPTPTNPVPANLQSIGMQGMSSRGTMVTTLQPGKAMKLTLEGTGDGTAQLTPWLNGRACSKPVLLSFTATTTSYMTQLPNFGRNIRSVALTTEHVSASTQVRHAHQRRSGQQSWSKACNKLSAALNRAK